MKTSNLHIGMVLLAVLLGAIVLAPAWTAQANSPLASSPLATPSTKYGDSLALSGHVWSWDTTHNHSNNSPTQSGTASTIYLPTIIEASSQPPTDGAGSIYIDQLMPGWQNWSWDTTSNLSNSSPVQSGTYSISATITSAWAAVYLHNDAGLSTVGYTTLRFWIHGGKTGGQKLQVIVNQNTDAPYHITPVANTWSQVDIPLSNIGAPESLTDLYWQDAAGAAENTFYLDNITLFSDNIPQPTPTPGGPIPTATPVSGGMALSVNASAGQHPISPYIYGMNFADETLAAELHLPVDRYGGNATTRYNWQNDTSNRASDWYFENIPNDNSNVGALPNGSSSDQFYEQDKRTGAATVMTVPLIGWTPKDRTRTCGFSVSKYGAQQYTDGDCGNGVKPGGGANITGNNPGDTSTAIGPSFVTNFVKHLVGRYGTAANGGVKFFNLDNEPMLWNSTHRDVHPDPVSYDELRDRTYQYAAAVKAGDPTAQTLGPVLWGWTAYFYSAKDVAQGGSYWDNPPDRNAHNGTPLVDWYLQQMKTYETSSGKRILDYLDLHYYPQSGVALTSAGNAALQAKRLRSTRSLWDANYTDESWINQPVRLIPRMKDWVNNNYPGTKTAITEYNYGGLESINGALAEADVLGIFGREGLDLAALWAPPTSSQPGAFAFRMYLNYDGSGSTFGDTSIQATSANQDTLSIYAAKRSSDGALTLMVINKTSSSQTGALSLTGFTTTAKAQFYRYSSANLKAIVRDADLALNGSGFSASFPSNSITLIIIPK